MAAIVGLLVLMVYLCTNIAYKFIPDKAKKNVKRMFTRKKDGAAAEDEPGGIKRGRSVVEAAPSDAGMLKSLFGWIKGGGLLKKWW